LQILGFNTPSACGGVKGVDILLLLWKWVKYNNVYIKLDFFRFDTPPACSGELHLDVDKKYFLL